MNVLFSVALLEINLLTYVLTSTDRFKENYSIDEAAGAIVHRVGRSIASDNVHELRQQRL